MNLIFVGLTPGESLKRGLLANSLPVEVVKRLPLPPGRWDLLIHAPKTPAALKDYAELRRANPDMWIAVVVPATLLRDPVWQNALLRCPEKNDVWPQESWESLFPFALQRMTESTRLGLRNRELEKELESLKEHYQELTRSSEKLVAQFERNVGLAGDIQRSLLPKRSPDIPGIQVAIKYIPAAGLGGDYYDFFEFGDRKRFGILLADSKTHGMAAALLSVLLKVRLEEMKDRFPDSRSFMEFLNDEIRGLHEKDLATLSLLYGILDRSTLSFQFSVAGHLQPHIWRGGRPVSFTPLKAPPLGGMDHYPFRDQTIQLEPGDLLLLHTDGLDAPLGFRNPEAATPEERIRSLLAGREPFPDALELQNEIMGFIDAYRSHGELPDDITLIHLAIDARALYVATSRSKPGKS